jgi:hypothetical protein
LHCSHTADALRVGRRLIAIEARELIDHAAHAEQVAPRSRAFALSCALTALCQAQRQWQSKAKQLDAE